MTLFHLNMRSANKKTGPIPVSTTSADSCPSTCPLKDAGCYADLGPLGLHWRKVTDGTNKKAVDGYQFLKEVRAIPDHMIWRHNGAGDLPHKSGYIDSVFTDGLVKANRKKRGFTYTHHDITKGENLSIIKAANQGGFTINLSANTKREAAAFFKLIGDSVPVVTILESDAPEKQYVDGVKVIACPAEKRPDVNCLTCKMCAVSKRDHVIGFRAHGIRKKKANIIAKG